MKSDGQTDSPQSAPTRAVTGRDRGRTAPARCACYAAFSELTASPHDFDPRPALAEKTGVGASLAYAAGLDELLREITACELDELRREYSGLFEVGSDGPPVPIREDLRTGQRAGTREDIVRFYDFFGYKLAEHFAWAPDHLSVELEFMHFLCYGEATEDQRCLSFQLAQMDFMERHLSRWVPGLADSAQSNNPDALYSRILGSLRDFVGRDLEWQSSTILADRNREPNA